MHVFIEQSPDMFQNHFKLAIRHLFADKQGTVIHLLGLVVGITGFLFLLQYAFFEKSYDKYHERANDLYRITADIYRGGELNVQSATTYLALPTALQSDFPEIESYVRLFPTEALISVEENRFRDDLLFYAESNLFKLFDMPIISGDADRALEAPNTAVLSETAALRYFGTTNCIGKRIELQNWHSQRDYEVTAIMADLPGNSHLQSEAFLSMSTLLQTPGTLSEWGWRDFYNYLIIQPGQAAELERKMNLTDYVADHYPRYKELGINIELHLQPVTDIHLHSDLSLEIGANGSARSVNLLLIIGLFILLMAWVNYINLTTAKAAIRAKEVGVRKTIGASRKDLIWQFLMQGLVLNGMALLMAIICVEAFQPFFHQLVGKNTAFEFAQEPFLLLGVIAFAITGLMLSSAYPAFVLSGFSPKSIFSGWKGNGATGSVLLRKSLIVFQFAMSILLIAGTITVFQQLLFMQQKDLGMDISQTLTIRTPSIENDDTLLINKLHLIKDRLRQHPNIKSLTASHVVPGDEFLWVPGIRRVTDGTANSNSRVIYLNPIDEAFIPQFGLKMLAGRNFRKEETGVNNSMIFTETACRELGFPNLEDAIGERFITMGDTFSLVGVCNDYQQWGFQKAAGDYVFINQEAVIRKLSMKIDPQDVSAALAFVRNTYNEVFPNELFEHVFLDQHFARQYEADEKFGQIAGLFAGLAIFIACLGLLGLSLFMALQRRKEIGIRKVLGASTAGLVSLLSKDFLKLVVIALVIASPLAYYFMDKWLQDFAYRIEISGWIFVLAGLIAVGVAFFTVSFQSLKAAMANPVESLRSE